MTIPPRKDSDVPGASPGRGRRDRPPLPKKLPGTFAVIAYNRDSTRYTMYVDDDRQSSYDLGSNVQGIMAYFGQWGHYKMLCDTLDLAREYGSAQGIFKDGRTIALFDRHPKAPDLFQDDHETLPISLPSVKG